MPSSSLSLSLSLFLLAGCSSAIGGGGGGATTTTTTDSTSTSTLTTGSGGATTTTGTGGAPSAEWALGRGDVEYDTASFVVIDPSTGDLLVAGDTMEINHAGMFPMESENGMNTYLARISAAGEVIWSRSFGESGADRITSVAIDPSSGDIVLTGQFSKSITLGGATLTTVSQDALFLARLDAGGNHLWSRKVGDYAYARAEIDPAGDIVLAGSFLQTIDLGGGPFTATPPIPGPFSAPATDLFLAKLDPSGAHQWSKPFGGPGGDGIQHLVVTPEGNIVIAGSHFDGGLDFGGGALPFEMSMAIFLATFDGAGNHLWSKGFNGPPSFTPPDTASPIDARGLAVTPGGDVLLAGDFMGVTDFGNGPLHTADPLNRNLFVTRFDAAGGVLWTTQFEAESGEQDISHATLDSAGGFTFTGLFRGSIDFGGGALTSNGADYDVFVTQLDGAGNHVFSKAYGGAGLDRGNAVAIDAEGRVFLAGTFTGTLSIGGEVLTSAGEQDAFVARVEP